MYHPRGRKRLGLGIQLGRQMSGFLFVVGVTVSIFLGLCIQSWGFVGPAEWAFCLLEGDLFLQI